MNNKNLFYVCIAFLFTTIYGYGLSKDEVLSSTGGPYYCKDDICVSTMGRINLDTIIIPNQEGRNITYITDTCSSKDIEMNICSSKECSDDSQCLSNKCTNGHCSYNEANPIVYCEYVYTHHDIAFFDKNEMHCGLPRGYKCKSNDDCSSHNCESYGNSDICGEPYDRGCTSMCDIGNTFFLYYGIPLIIIIIIIVSCICCFCKGRDLDKERENNNNQVEV